MTNVSLEIFDIRMIYRNINNNKYNNRCNNNYYFFTHWITSY